jgi:release factor glutamine methyltransferase
MKKTLNSIREQLSTFYPKEEIRSVSLWIAEFVTKCSPTQLLAFDVELTSEWELQINEIIEKLRKHYPIQYIIGEVEFCDLRFSVNENVLIPRPETAELVLWILQETKAKTILDIGTGSGCISISLAKKIESAQIYAFDVSTLAIEVAKKNAIKNGVKNIHFQEVNILKPYEGEEKYDLIVSNPPYITQKEKQDMQKQIIDFEPNIALFVEDEEPLIFYEKIAKFAQQHLQKNGFLFFEINRQFGREIISLLKNLNFSEIELKKDSFGNNRMIKAIWK